MRGYRVKPYQMWILEHDIYKTCKNMCPSGGNLKFSSEALFLEEGDEFLSLNKYKLHKQALTHSPSH